MHSFLRENKDRSLACGQRRRQLCSKKGGEGAGAGEVRQQANFRIDLFFSWFHCILRARDISIFSSSLLRLLYLCCLFCAVRLKKKGLASKCFGHSSDRSVARCSSRILRLKVLKKNRQETDAHPEQRGGRWNKSEP